MKLDPPLALRPTRADDEAFLFGLYASTREDLGGLASIEGPLAILLRQQFDSREAQYRGTFPEASLDLILRDGEPVGRLSVDRASAEFVLIDIALMPSERGLGWGSLILERLVRDAERTGRDLRLRVLLTNPARALYRRLGFEETGDDGMYATMTRAATGSPVPGGSQRE